MERKLGVILPRDIIGSRDIVGLVKEIENIGFNYVVACDHVVLQDQEAHKETLKYSLKDSYTDPLTLLSAIATTTSNVELFTGVMILPQRQTVLVARQAADVDIFSGGRLKLGVGVGWVEDEFQAMGTGKDFSRRGKRMEEQITLLRLLWTQNSVTFANQNEKVEAMGLNPKPIQQPIPIWMGGTDLRVIKRTVKIADGWIPRGKVELFNNELYPALREQLEIQKRDPLTLPIMGKVNVRWESGENDWKKEGENWMTSISVTHLSIGSIGGDKKRADDHLEILLKAMTFFKK